MTLFKSPLLVLDTESSGLLKHDWARVVEVGAVLLGTDGSEVARFESFVFPDILDERAAEALAINHITAEMLATAPTAPEVAHTFGEWFRMLADPLTPDVLPYVTAFNVGFDRPMLARMGIRDLRWASCIMLRASDIMGAAGAVEPSMYGGYRWPKLAHAAEFFGVEVVGEPHRALTDARTAAGVACAIRRRETTTMENA